MRYKEKICSGGVTNYVAEREISACHDCMKMVRDRVAGNLVETESRGFQ